MATASTSLGEIEDQYFTCSLCLDSLKEPKLLPCLHRYCRGCLHEVIAGEKDTFKCPLCNEECDVPPEGVDGFKTDFFVKSLLEFLQLQSAYTQDNVKQCHGCKEDKVVTCYCFTCRNFLCQQCHQFHLNNDMVEEHRPHLLDLETVDVRSLTLEKLASLAEDPRCAEHIKHLAQLCCETCDNLPICVACIYGDHEGHVTHEVRKLARAERTKLEKTSEELGKYRENVFELPKRVEKVSHDLAANVEKQLQRARTKHKEASDRILKKAEAAKANLDGQRRSIVERKERQCSQVQVEMEEEMKKLKTRYGKILKEKEHNFGQEVGEVDRKTGIVDDTSKAEMNEVNHKLHSFETKVHASQLDYKEQVSVVADHSTRRINRYKNFTATSTTVQASHNEWTEAQCLPAITAAGEVLITDAKREFGELESLSDTGVEDLSFRIVDDVTVSEGHESVVDMKGIGDGWRVDGITSNSNGRIIVTGQAGRDTSHITVINREGGVISKIQLERAVGSHFVPYRHCGSLSQYITATVCGSNQVGIYDIRNGGHIKKDIKDMGIYWPNRATCVATDTMNTIYVGGEGGYVLVLDDQLNHRYTMKLPEIIVMSRDIAVHNNNLIVCDWERKSAYAVTLEEGKTDVVYQLPGPDGEDWHPWSVCSDRTNHIYMLWMDGANERMLTQYSQDGRKLLATRQVDENARCITVLETGVGEKLLVATLKTKKLYTFRLN